jgi:RNA polymerase sigma-70 factor (ECF subfamily)
MFQEPFPAGNRLVSRMLALKPAVVDGQLPRHALTSKGSGEVNSPDLELANRCRSGDVAAFEELYRTHSGRLFNLTFRMVGAEAAEDLLQEVFLLAHRKLGGFRGESTLATWLYRLATNHCLDHLRGRQTQMGRVTDSLDDDGAAEPVSEGPIGPITRMDLERAIERLPAGCRAAFLLHDVEGFEHREIAGILGVAEGTSKSQVHKARMKLRGLLGRRERVTRTSS